MKSKFLEEWFREIFFRDIEKLKKSVLVVIDNAKFHRIKKDNEGNGGFLLFFSPYSLDFNSI